MANDLFVITGGLPQQRKPIRPLSLDDFSEDADGITRVADWRLAEVLNFARSSDIHELIHRHSRHLEQFGTLPYRTGKSSGGRPGNEYRLNFNQAIFIVIKSEASNAIPVQIHVVTIYGLWAMGKLKPVDNDTAVIAAQSTAQAYQLAPELMELFQSLAGRIDDLATHTDATDILDRIHSLQRTSYEIAKSIEDHAPQKKAVPPADVKKKQDDAVIYDRDGWCPICAKVQIFIPHRVNGIIKQIEKTRRYHYAHLYNKGQAGWFLSMPMCDECNQKWEPRGFCAVEWVQQKVMAFHRLLKERYGVGLTGSDGALF